MAINLNYLLLQVLQEKETKEKALEEITEFITNNTPKVEVFKDTKKWLDDFAKKHPQRAVLGKVNYENNLQVMTDSVLLVARSENYYLKGLEEATSKDNYPKVEKILTSTKTKSYKINLKQLYNACQLLKSDNPNKVSVDLYTNGLEIALGIEVVERAYKLSGIEEASLQFIACEEAHKKPITITSKDKSGSIIVVITPMIKQTYDKDLYLTSEGNIELLNSDKVVKVSLEAPKKEVEKSLAETIKKETTKATTTDTKVLPKVRGIKAHNGGEKATRKQLSYLLLLSGRQYSEDMTKAEASREITRLKAEQYSKADLSKCDA